MFCFISLLDVLAILKIARMTHTHLNEVLEETDKMLIAELFRKSLAEMSQERRQRSQEIARMLIAELLRKSLAEMSQERLRRSAEIAKNLIAELFQKVFSRNVTRETPEVSGKS